MTMYKPIGISCLDLLNQMRKNEEYMNVKLGFSGKLDEMAHGKIIVLLGDETIKTRECHEFNKVYKFRFIIGLETDTTSVLGLFQNKINSSDDIIDINEVVANINGYKNVEYMQEYHIYSAICPKHKEIHKPLWWWANNGKMNEIEEIPTKKVKVYDVKINNIKKVGLEELIKESMENLNKVDKNKFRCEEIMNQWIKYYEENKTNNKSFTELEIEISVSSGFYVRQFVKEIGKKFNINVMVTEIERLGYFII